MVEDNPQPSLIVYHRLECVVKLFFGLFYLSGRNVEKPHVTTGSHSPTFNKERGLGESATVLICFTYHPTQFWMIFFLFSDKLHCLSLVRKHLFGGIQFIPFVGEYHVYHDNSFLIIFINLSYK